jgi:hypothetical protein
MAGLELTRAGIGWAEIALRTDELLLIPPFIRVVAAGTIEFGKASSTP